VTPENFLITVSLYRISFDCQVGFIYLYYLLLLLLLLLLQ
jgi:hypothetical protein